MALGIASWIVLSIAAPWALSDQNGFLRGFVTHEFLGFMGVLVTITLASAANLHIELNKFEEKAGTRFTQTKRHIRHAATILIAMLVMAIVLVVAKPLLPTGETSQSFSNGAALLILLLSILTLIDIMLAAFALGPPPNARS